jgi:hypothetical protein
MWRHDQPLNEIMEALYDWLGIENKSPPRPSIVGVRKIAREYKRDVQPAFRVLGAKSKKLAMLFKWRVKDLERRLEIGRREQEIMRRELAKSTKILKIDTWRFKAMFGVDFKIAKDNLRH